MAQTNVGVRKYLTDNGFKDQDITYDANRKMVQVQGKDFYGAAPETDGSTYGNYNDLNGALNNYRTQQRNAQLDGLVNTLTQKASNNQPFQYQAPTAFSYNPQNDQQYQNALEAAKQSAQTATNNAMVQLGRRGIGNSSSATTQANGIQQNAMAKVNTELLPQLQQQAYGRWFDQANRDYQTQRDNYNSQQDQYSHLNGLVSLISGLDTQAFNNNLATSTADRQKQLDHIDLANYLSDKYEVHVDPKDDPALAYAQVKGLTPVSEKERADRNTQIGIENNRADKQLDATLRNMSADNVRAAASASRAAGDNEQARLFDIWDRTGVAPEGINGVPAGTRINKGVSASPSGSTFNLDDYKGYINNSFYQDVPVDPKLPYGDKKKVFDSEGARRYILGLNVPPEQIVQMLQLYQLPLTTK